MSTYPDMNAGIVDILEKADNPVSLYAAARIRQLEGENERLRNTLENQENALRSCIDSHEVFEAENNRLQTAAADVVAENVRLAGEVERLQQEKETISKNAARILHDKITELNGLKTENQRLTADNAGYKEGNEILVDINRGQLARINHIEAEIARLTAALVECQEAFDGVEQ